MLRTMLLFILFVPCIIGRNYKCGPHLKCTCYEQIKQNAVSMNCSKRNVSVCDVCNAIGNITDLDLSFNNVTDVRGECLGKCRGLESLTLNHNSIQHISGTFKNLHRLKQLDLSFNRLNLYENSGYHSLGNLPSNLTLLKLQHNINLTQNYSYPNISHLRSLDTLFIDGVPNTQFGHSYRYLRQLFMSGFTGLCTLDLITNETFQNLKHIELLDISNCSITNMYAGGFTELYKLEHLNMSYNQQLGIAIFRNVSYSLQFTRIKTLNASKIYNTFGAGITLRKRDVCFMRNTTLKELDISSNRLSFVETNLPLLIPSSLKIVHFNDNMFAFGPYVLQLSCTPNVTEVYGNFMNAYHSLALFLREKQNMEVLDENITDDCPFMTDDYLRNISNGIQNCLFINSDIHSLNEIRLPKALRKLVYRDGNMKYIIAHFPLKRWNNDIEYLDFSGNVLYYWQGPIGPLPRLKYLDLSRNYCSNIGKHFFHYARLIENLQIDHNFIGLVLSDNSSVGIFKYLSMLKTLNISNNHITSIAAGHFSNVHALVTLDLSFNDIGEWTIDCHELTNLTHLNISFNALRTLPGKLTSHFDGLVRRNVSFSINYRGNTVACSCEHKQFLHWLLDHKANFVDYEQYTFTDMDGKLISAEKFEAIVGTIDKTCASYVAYIVVSALALSVVISITIGGVIYRNRWKLRYLLYMSKNKFFGYKHMQNEEEIQNFRYDAFISYAEENIRFILNGIIPELDRLSLCIHQRDFIAGNAVADNIIDAIQTSRRTVVILSKAFLKSKWCMYEFNMARMESIYTRPGQRTLIIVMFEDVPIKDMPNELSHWIMTESYLEYTDDRHGQIIFWNQLAHALGQEIETTATE